MPSFRSLELQPISNSRRGGAEEPRPLRFSRRELSCRFLSQVVTIQAAPTQQRRCRQAVPLSRRPLPPQAPSAKRSPSSLPLTTAATAATALPLERPQQKEQRATHPHSLPTLLRQTPRSSSLRGSLVDELSDASSQLSSRGQSPSWIFASRAIELILCSSERSGIPFLTSASPPTTSPPLLRPCAPSLQQTPSPPLQLQCRASPLESQDSLISAATPILTALPRPPLPRSRAREIRGDPRPSTLRGACTTRREEILLGEMRDPGMEEARARRAQ